MPLDVTDASQVEDVINSTVTEFGRIDILMNNAAYPRGKDRLPMLDVPEDVFQRVVDIKITGAFLCTKAATRQMIAQGQGGKIVNVSLVLAKEVYQILWHIMLQILLLLV